MFLSLLQLHAAHTDDLTHQEETLSDEVTAAQILNTEEEQQEALQIDSLAQRKKSNAFFLIFRSAIQKFGVKTFF